MESAFRQYGFFALVLLIGVFGLVAAGWRSKKVSRGGKRSPIDYVLLWPLLIGKDPESSGIEKNQRAGISKRVVIGWLFVAVLAGLAMFFYW
jgi:hypothetical protein